MERDAGGLGLLEGPTGDGRPGVTCLVSSIFRVSWEGGEGGLLEGAAPASVAREMVPGCLIYSIWVGDGLVTARREGLSSFLLRYCCTIS